MNSENTFIEMRGDREILIDGVSLLLGYSDKEIMLLLKKRKLRVSGSDLKMDLMNESRIAISGKIISVEFADERRADGK